MQNPTMQKTVMMFVNNCFNDTKRDVIAEVKQKLKDTNKTSFTLNDIEQFLDELSSSVKTNKKIKKTPKKRYTAYHAFLKLKRAEVKEAHPCILPQDLTKIVAKAWKDVPEEDRKFYETRAMEMKAADEASTSA